MSPRTVATEKSLKLTEGVTLGLVANFETSEMSSRYWTQFSMSSNRIVGCDVWPRADRASVKTAASFHTCVRVIYRSSVAGFQFDPEHFVPLAEILEDEGAPSVEADVSGLRLEFLYACTTRKSDMGSG